MVEGFFGDQFYMRQEGEGGVQDDSKVTDMRGGVDNGFVDVQCEGAYGFGEGFGTDDQDFRFIAVEFEEVHLHPVFNVSQTGDDGSNGGVRDGFDGEVELCVVRVAVEPEAMTAEDLSEGEEVQNKEEGTKHRALGDTVDHRRCG